MCQYLIGLWIQESLILQILELSLKLQKMAEMIFLHQNHRPTLSHSTLKRRFFSNSNGINRVVKGCFIKSGHDLKLCGKFLGNHFSVTIYFIHQFELLRMSLRSWVLMSSVHMIHTTKGNPPGSNVLMRNSRPRTADEERAELHQTFRGKQLDLSSSPILCALQ